MLADISNISSELDQFARGGGGMIRLGILPSLSSSQFSVHERPTDELLGQLGDNKLDLTFGRVLQVSQSAKLRASKVCTEAFNIVCSARHRLATLAEIRWKEIAGEKWVLPAMGSPLREIADSMFTERGDLRPVVAIACSNFHQMRHVIAARELLGVLPHSMAERATLDGDLVILRPKQAAQVAPISLIVRGDINPSPMVAAFRL